MKELELKEMMARHRQELSEKDITISSVSFSSICSDDGRGGRYDRVLFVVQLEEANRTLTSDVANLANEKEELNNKLKEAHEG